MGKIQVVRVGSEARVPRAEIERLLGQTDERPDLDRQIEWLEAWVEAERPGREVLVRVVHWLWPGRCPEAVAAVTQASL